MKRILLLLTLLIIPVLYVKADDKATLTVDVPDVVVNGDQFRLAFTVNSKDVKNFRAPSFPDAFDVLAGPYQSFYNSTQIINGKTTSVSTVTYNYTLMARKEGTFTIPAASIDVDGEKIFSAAAQVKVLPPDQDTQDSDNTSKQGGSSSVKTQKAGSQISDDELFITATASKTKVYEQEAILLTYKVYTNVNLRQLYGDMPDLKGFHTQQVELPQQKTFTIEHYKGRNYHTTVWSQYVLFPQQTGKLEIPSITFDGVVAQQMATDDLFDSFFNGGGIVEVKKKIVTPKLTINVEPLPTKPAGFSGGVGTFSISSSINATEVKTNDAVTVKVIIKGTGNMKLISTPEVKFPQDFEIYDPKTDNQFQLTKDGLSGTQTIEYLAIPRHAGNFTIPPVEFTYFDLKSKSYKTLKTEAYELKVAKGEGNAEQVVNDFTNKEQVKVLGEDIRFIKLGDTKLSPRGVYFFGTTGYWLWYVIPAILFVGFIVVYRQRALENANIAKMKTKKANKVATKRLKLAGKLLNENKKNEFYDEVLKALWGYISDKLNIPVSQLSKDNIEFELNKYGVSAELTKDFIAALNECEFARYAPGDENAAMDKVYTTASDVISKMEDSIKH